MLVNDPGFMADPHPAYAALRTAAPVRRATTPDGSPVWLVTRYADVRLLLNDPRLSLSKRNSAGKGYGGFALPPSLDANLLNIDPPDHTRLRRLVTREFTARRVEQLRPFVRRVTNEMLDQVACQSRADLMAALAMRLPLTVISELLGVPPEDGQQFRSWTTNLLAPQPGQPPEQAKEAVAGLHRLLINLVVQKRAKPGGDLISALVSVREEDEERLSEDELTSLAFLILWAGYETTVHLIGNGILALLTHPEQLARLQAQPGLYPSAVEEMLRFANPNPFSIRRFPLEDVRIGEHTIPAGDTVLLCLAAAHRDPSRFRDPDRFDVAREDNAHLAFGHGIHHCLGSALARLETEVAVSTLFERFPGLALARPVDHLSWRPSFRSRGLQQLPVTL
ncbi:cytochrome [Couchioplanes caeruleus subsp. caeruleus]|uniref:Cytochrome n=1 Tax=Couchioplanes caeruleus subsp. caeruleus TaxID=56427 RepID=A0A1K0GDW3_9ACTN|nr:cytochrome [Couchioplanes caeruleus subsp. caeruleus]